MAATNKALAVLSDEIASCRMCTRLVAWREQAPNDPRHIGDPSHYWARGVPGFGDPNASLALVGLAPAAHGANRTGRMFTGDRSGDFLFAALCRTGFANQPTSVSGDDGLELAGAYVTSAVRCAPPENRPSPAERAACAPFLRRELAALGNLRVVLALGAFALDALVRDAHLELDAPKRPRFAHAMEIGATGPTGAVTLLCAYHPSQRNVFTGLLSAAMLDEVLARAKALTGAS